MDRQTQDYYHRNAASLLARYSAPASIAGLNLEEAFQGKTKILDVGCGTGRDLAFLLRKGKDAYGVDAVPEMLAQASGHLKSQGLDGTGRLYPAELPDLDLFDDGEFDGVLCSAVLMHLEDERLFDAVYSLRRVLKPGGVLLVSLPARRPDVDPQSKRDWEGRLFTGLVPAKLQLLLERIGFVLEAATETEDSLGRDGVQWWAGRFRKADDAGDRPLHLVEGILNRDKKDATYKLALFRALAEIAQTQSHLAAFLPEGKVKIPLREIAEKWILYYWPIFASEGFIPQRTNETENARLGVAIRKPVDALINHYADTGGLTGFYVDWKKGTMTRDAEKLFRSAVSKLQSVIHTMPAKHAGGGHYAVFQYDGHDQTLLMDVALWRELCLMGSWIRDATILRWAEQTEVFAKGGVKASAVIDCLLLAPDQGRNVKDAQAYFLALGKRPCVWSHKELAGSSFAVDHAMPFSYWRNNDLWNLFPSHPVVNSRKSDKLPTYRQLQASEEIIIDYWRGMEHAMGERFEREARTLLGREPFVRGNWEKLLFGRFVEAFETTAAQRGAERWELEDVLSQNQTTQVVRVKPSAIRYAEPEEWLGTHEAEPANYHFRAPIVPFEEVGEGAFKTHLPILGNLAAGVPFHGFEGDSMSDLSEMDWMEVPTRLAGKNRFLVRVAGDSMLPTFHVGELLVFEYHRSPRKDKQIVIANIPDFGPGHAGVEAIKRITQNAASWIFESDNEDHAPIVVPKSETSHPILGTFVDKIEI
jgi:SAM-dependent methyltransferase/phage repressor protein C with HTH and peptisase S24 domain